MVSPSTAVLVAMMAACALATPPFLPGSQLVGQAFDVLTFTRFGFTRSAGNIFQLNYNMTTQAFEKEYSYPWGMQQPAAGVSECQRTVNTLSVKTMEDYRRETTDDIAIGAKYKSFSGSYSTSTREVRQHLSKQGLWVSESRTLCVKYQLTLLPGYVQFDPMFLNDAKALPINFTSSSPAAHFNFFDKWNTHIMTRCSVGGAMSELAYTVSSYTKDHTEDDVKTQASASFIASIDHKASSSTAVDKEFSQSTNFIGIEIHGGRPTDDNQWATWMGSVMDLDNPVCLDGEATDYADIMTSRWTADGDLHVRAPGVKQALLKYFHRPGCRNPLFPNYDEKALQDDGSCGPKVSSLRLRAYIDVEDYVLIGVGSQLKWVHGRGVDVGVQGGHNYPVTLTFTMENGNVHELAWYPQHSRVFSSPYPLDYCAAAKFTKYEGRDTATLSELGTLDNQWTNQIKLYDDPDGAAWYDCELSWKAADACHSGLIHERGFAVTV